MKHLLTLLILVTHFANSQNLELINVDNVKEINLDEGIELELKINVVNFKTDSSKYEIMPLPINLKSRFVVIPKDTGLVKIGPFKVGNLVSNEIYINVVSKFKKDYFVDVVVDDTAIVGNEFVLKFEVISDEALYILRNLNLKSSKKYKSIKQSYFYEIKNNKDEVAFKETLTITLVPLKKGILKVDDGFFVIENNEKLIFKSKKIIVMASSQNKQKK